MFLYRERETLLKFRWFKIIWTIYSRTSDSVRGCVRPSVCVCCVWLCVCCLCVCFVRPCPLVRDDIVTLRHLFSQEDKTPVVIAPHHGGDSQRWNFRYGFIECMKDQNFVLSESNGKLILERKSVNFTYQKWECLRSSISIEKAIAKPATTCHLRSAIFIVIFIVS